MNDRYLGGREQRCPICGKWHLIPVVGVSCCVYHPPGDCCHYGHKEVPEPKWFSEQTP